MAGTGKSRRSWSRMWSATARLAGADKIAHCRGCWAFAGDLIDTAIDSHQRRIVKRTIDDGLIEFCIAYAEHHAVGVLNDSLWFLTGVQ